MVDSNVTAAPSYLSFTVLQMPKQTQPAPAAAAEVAVPAPAQGYPSDVTLDDAAQRQATYLLRQPVRAQQQYESRTPSGSRQHSSCTSAPPLPSAAATAAAAAAAAATPSALAAAAAHLLLTTRSAAAAKIEVDVPDFLVENNPLDAVLHSPVLAVGAAALALLLFPKLIRVSHQQHHLATPVTNCYA
jgi:hypothetical protein